MKDALGHGSEARGGGGPKWSIDIDEAGNQTGSHGVSDARAAAALAQGHPKSGGQDWDALGRPDAARANLWAQLSDRAQRISATNPARFKYDETPGGDTNATMRSLRFG
jgi:hypothetical protein